MITGVSVVIETKKFLDVILVMVAGLCALTLT